MKMSSKRELAWLLRLPKNGHFSPIKDYNKRLSHFLGYKITFKAAGADFYG